MIVALAIATNIAPAQWMQETDETIATAIAILEEAQED